jgi:hypothetical protein
MASILQKFPWEIRNKIFKQVLADDFYEFEVSRRRWVCPKSAVNLLVTCKGVRDEFMPVLNQFKTDKTMIVGDPVSVTRGLAGISTLSPALRARVRNVHARTSDLSSELNKIIAEFPELETVRINIGCVYDTTLAMVPVVLHDKTEDMDIKPMMAADIELEIASNVRYKVGELYYSKFLVIKHPSMEIVSKQPSFLGTWPAYVVEADLRGEIEVATTTQGGRGGGFAGSHGRGGGAAGGGSSATGRAVSQASHAIRSITGG